MKAGERERKDWVIVLIILVMGFLCVLAAGQLALRFAPGWQLNTNMDSHLDPNSDFLTQKPDGFLEAVDSSILTQPSWLNIFLTPGASFVTGTPLPRMTYTSFPSPAPTIVASVTNTAVIAQNPTNTFVYIATTQTATSRPASTVAPPTQSITLPATSTVISPATQTATATTTGTITATPALTATITPTLVVTDATPGNIGTIPDGNIYNLYSGGTLTLGINLIANGDSSFDLVYYELPGGSGILLDWAIVEIGDGSNWYTIFNWGNNIDDTNTNVYSYLVSNPQTPSEPDQRNIPSSALYGATGIAIDIDSIVPPGTYSYIRFTAPVGDADGHMEIDAIEILP